MENNRSNEEALAAHREAFYREVDDYFSKFDSSHALVKSRSDYADLIMFLSGPAKDKTVKKSKADYYAMKNYVVMQGRSITKFSYLRPLRNKLVSQNGNLFFNSSF